MCKLLLVLLCLLPPAVVAQNATRVGGPITGMVFDGNARTLRPMVGVPGASYLGDAVSPALDAAAVSPDGDLALASVEGRMFLISGLKSLAPATTAIDVLAGDVFAWSPDGESAAIYSKAKGQVQLLREVRGSVAPGATIEVGGSTTVLGVGNAGDVVAGLESGLYLLAPGAAPRLLAELSSPGAIAFRGRDLLAAGGGRILLVENFSSAPAASVLVEDAGTIVGLQISPDGKRMIAADAANRLLKVFELATRTAAAQVALDCVPTELRAFGAGSAWLLNSVTGGSEPLYVATSGSEPAVWFVPAGRAQ